MLKIKGKLRSTNSGKLGKYEFKGEGNYFRLG